MSSRALQESRKAFATEPPLMGQPDAEPGPNRVFRYRLFNLSATGGARIVGSHFYGPYFARPARGCHPDQEFLTPNAENAEAFTKLATKMPLAITVAPEIVRVPAPLMSAPPFSVRVPAAKLSVAPVATE